MANMKERMQLVKTSEIRNRGMNRLKVFKKSLCAYSDVPHTCCSKILLKNVINLLCEDFFLGAKIHCPVSSPISSPCWEPYNPV